LRLFVALELPDEVVEALRAWAAPLGLRPATLPHVTLVFVGEREEAVVLPALSSPAPVLALTGAAWFGPDRRALAVTFGDEGGRALALRDAVLAALSMEPERRRFRPHATVAHRARRVPRPASLPSVPALAPFAAAAVTLFRSTPGPRGSRYDALARIPLS
jgi:RNA 2',3'-cyclic 3'-phosphodiesterase